MDVDCINDTWRKFPYVIAISIQRLEIIMELSHVTYRIVGVKINRKVTCIYKHRTHSCVAHKLRINPRLHYDYEMRHLTSNGLNNLFKQTVYNK